MRRARRLAAALCFASCSLLQAQTPPAGDAAPVLAATRQALGGAERIAGVKAFVATGRTRQVRGENLVPIEFEISCELPDKYVRRDEIPAQESGPTTVGFNGSTLIQLPAPPPPPAGAPASAGRAGMPPPSPAQLDAMRAARAAAVKGDLARLLLGMFAGAQSSMPLTFTYAGIAEAPQGQADVLDAKGASGFAVRFFVARDTHLPIMVSWQAPAPPQPQPAENRLYFGDYRDVDGLKLPFRIRRAVGADTIEETTFDRFRINARIDPKKFAVR